MSDFLTALCLKDSLGLKDSPALFTISHQYLLLFLEYINNIEWNLDLLLFGTARSCFLDLLGLRIYNLLESKETFFQKKRYKKLPKIIKEKCFHSPWF